MKNQKWVVGSLALTLLSLAPLGVEAHSHDTYVVVEEAPPVYASVEVDPPADMEEVMTPSPGADYAWIKGHWRWNGKWEWESGHWLVRPHSAAVWVPGFWLHKHHHHYDWVAGHWE